MRATVGFWLTLSLWACVAAAGPPEPGGSLAARLDTVLGSRALARAEIGALVVNAADGSVLYARHADRALTPASNAKILTAMAALATFGPAHRFETVISADAPLDAKGEVGRLFVRGGGDPALNSEDWWRLAADLRRSGLRRVRGALVLDDSAFDRERWHPNWGTTSSRAYHAPVGALTANYGAFAVTIVPSPTPGLAPRVAIDPPVPYLRLANQATTKGRRTRGSTVVDRRAASDFELVTVAGTVRSGSEPKTYYRSVLDPTRYAGSVLRLQLAANGIEVAGATEQGRVPEFAVELLRYQGRPLAEVVRLFTKFSNNAVAETLVKSMGAHDEGEGSWAAGQRAMRQRLVALGLDPKSLVLVDGSGLSYDNKVSPRALVTALGLARRSFEFGPELVAALPIANADGTLEKRAEGAAGAVRAKTGLLNQVVALSGFARLAGPDGPGEAIFSLLVNGYRVTDEEAMDQVDRFIAEMVRSAAQPASSIQ